MDLFNLGYNRGRYPAGQQDFASIRNNNQVYVDKTKYIFELTRQSFSYFLSRPRRFGKSLLLSTIGAYFEGRKELFDGLDIAKLEKDWTPHPVIRIDFSSGMFTTVNGAIESLNSQMRRNARLLSIELTETTPDGQFSEIIEKSYFKYQQSVVVLIDEYDKPLLETRYEEDILHKDMTDLMRGFYGCLKANSQYLRFVMITGITKISHVNIFSGLNNLTDLSLQTWCNAICGISESEMMHYFKEDMDIFGRINKLEIDDVRKKFKHYYDGYHFAEYGENIYNPYSVMLAFQNMKFSNYWFTSGLPNHVVKSISRYNFNFNTLEGRKATENQLSGIATTDANPIGLLYQSGYLTIKNFEDNMYTIGFPNKEVESGFFDTVLMVEYPDHEADGFSAFNVLIAAKEGKPARIVELLDKALIDYNYEQHKDIDSEAVLNSLLYGLTHAVGLNVKAEYHTANGRIDMVIETKHYIYLFEFKINKSAKLAMEQIENKAYPNKYKYDTRQLFKIAINYNTDLRQITETLIT